jgi:hypothetical protein
MNSPTLRCVTRLRLTADPDVLDRSKHAKNVKQPENHRNNYHDIYNRFYFVIHRYISIDKPQQHANDY